MADLRTRNILLIASLIAFQSCDTGSSESTVSQSSSNSETMNTEKLIGTPFENLSSGDDFNEYNFLCGRYRSNKIDSFPIYIFSAFFTATEEEIIQEGIDIANQAIGYVAFALTETWANDVRIIYKVEFESGDSDYAGHTVRLNNSYNDDVLYANDPQVVDWTIMLTDYGINKWVVGHELGHAMGLEHHYTNLETQEIYDLEENSIMDANGPYGSTIELGDYTEMMTIRGQIMERHLGQEGVLDDSSLNANCDYYGLGIENEES